MSLLEDFVGAAVLQAVPAYIESLGPQLAVVSETPSLTVSCTWVTIGFDGSSTGLEASSVTSLRVEMFVARYGCKRSLGVNSYPVGDVAQGLAPIVEDLARTAINNRFRRR